MTAPIDRAAARARCDAVARGRHVLDLRAALDALDQADAENQRLKHDLWAKQGSIELRDVEIARLRKALEEIAKLPIIARSTVMAPVIARRALGGEG